MKPWLAHVNQKIIPTAFSEVKMGRPQARGTPRSWSHSALQDDKGPLFNLQPDVVTGTLPRPIVLDTKWKELNSADERKLGVTQTDVYQILMYGQAYDAERLVLLYPWRSGLDEGIIKSNLSDDRIIEIIASIHVLRVMGDAPPAEQRACLKDILLPAIMVSQDG